MANKEKDPVEGITEALAQATLTNDYNIPTGIYNQVENYNIFMSFVKQGIKDKKALVVASPFVDDVTLRHLIGHTMFSDSTEYSFDQIVDYLENKLGTNQKDDNLEIKLLAKRKIHFFTREEQFKKLNRKYADLVKRSWYLYLSPTRNPTKYFHCKFAACVDANNANVLLTSANLTTSHMKDSEPDNYHQRDSSVSVSMSRGEFIDQLLKKMDITEDFNADI